MNLTPELSERMRGRAEDLRLLVSHLSGQENPPDQRLVDLAVQLATDVVTLLTIIDRIRGEIDALYEEP